MATRTIPAKVVTTDDFTGKELAADDKPVKIHFTVKIGANGKPVTAELDTAEALANMLTRFLAEPTDETRRAIGDTRAFPRSPVGSGSGSGSSGGSRQPTDKAGTTMRAWLREHGFPNVKDGQGRVPEDAKTAWQNHLQSESAAA